MTANALFGLSRLTHLFKLEDEGNDSLHGEGNPADGAVSGEHEDKRQSGLRVRNEPAEQPVQGISRWRKTGTAT